VVHKECHQQFVMIAVSSNDKSSASHHILDAQQITSVAPIVTKP
jgi:hypothetical protein